MGCGIIPLTVKLSKSGVRLTSAATVPDLKLSGLLIFPQKKSTHKETITQLKSTHTTCTEE